MHPTHPGLAPNLESKHVRAKQHGASAQEPRTVPRECLGRGRGTRVCPSRVLQQPPRPLPSVSCGICRGSRATRPTGRGAGRVHDPTPAATMHAPTARPPSGDVAARGQATARGAARGPSTSKRRPLPGRRNDLPVAKPCVTVPRDPGAANTWVWALPVPIHDGSIVCGGGGVGRSAVPLGATQLLRQRHCALGQGSWVLDKPEKVKNPTQDSSNVWEGMGERRRDTQWVSQGIAGRPGCMDHPCVRASWVRGRRPPAPCTPTWNAHQGPCNLRDFLVSDLFLVLDFVRGCGKTARKDPTGSTLSAEAKTRRKKS